MYPPIQRVLAAGSLIGLLATAPAALPRAAYEPSAMNPNVMVTPVAAPTDWDRAVALYNKADYRAALAEFQALVLESPHVAGAWYYIGLCEFKLKRYKKVHSPLARAIDLLEIQSPDSPDVLGAWYTIGVSHYLLGEFDKTIEPLTRYIALAAKSKREADPGARTALGRSHFFLGQYDEALPLLATTSPAAGSAKENGQNFYYLGAIYFKREDDDRAIACLREAMKTDAEDRAVLEMLAESLIRKARKSNVEAVWLEAAETGERLRGIHDDLRAASVLGRAYLGARKFDKAAPALEKLARADPDSGQAWLYYGIALSRSGQMRKAMETLEITIRLMPDSMPALAELAYVYESDKQYQQALRIYEKAYAATNDPAIKGSIERVRALASQQP